MKTLLQVLATVGMFLALYEQYKGRTDGAILFLIWSFYLEYQSDQTK